MEKIFNPVNGENGYFISEQEYVVINAILQEYSMNHIVHSPNTGECVADE